VLSKHHGGALIQFSQPEIFQLATVLQHEMQKHGALLQGVLTPSQRKHIESLIKQSETQGSQASYAPQSGEIFGILKAMKESFETNLSDAQKDELNGKKSYADLKATKEAEIAAAQGQLDTKTQDLATTDEKLANDKQDVTDTTDSLTADEKFLMDLKERCAMTDKEWEARSKERQLEIEAVSKALAFLTSDEAHDLFSKTFNFAQMRLQLRADAPGRRPLAAPPERLQAPVRRGSEDQQSQA